jgi:tight adherence protein B
MSGIVALMLFVAMSLAGYAAALWVQQRNEARRALATRLETMTGPGVDRLAAPLLKDQRLSTIPMLDALLSSIPFVKPMVRMIRQAGLKRRVGEVLLYIPLLALVTFLLATLVGLPTLVCIVLSGVAGAIPLLVVARIRQKRAMRFAEQLPDALDLVRSALQAGHGLLSAMGVVAETFPDPVAQEFRWVGEEVRLGLPLRDALYHLAERVDDPNLPILVVGILVAQDVGGNLAEVIDNVTYTIRERFKLMREMRVLTAQGRLSATVLTGLPFGLGAFLMVMNPGYFAPMIHSTTGNWMLAYALGSILVGHFMIRRIVQIRA